jgi:hypothetical protein
VIDIILIVTGTVLAFLLAATTYAAYEYYKQLRKAQSEYVKARDMIEDIVLSFNRELKREAEKTQAVAFKVEVAASAADAGLSKGENIEKRLEPIIKQIGTMGTKIENITSAVATLSEANVKTLETISSADNTTLDAKVQDIESAQQALKAKMAGLEEQVQKLSVAPEERTEAPMPLPVMPIKRDKAMAALTDTEVAVLEFLSSEGPKTAPEIKEKVQLSREHTARLMKRLYEEGYLERETVKLPFKYSVKKEMEKLLKKPEFPTV